ncbi:hypothetical protein AAHC03_026602 [Spirometra sp. Aus1]|nr:unnamed protein product [Spirometra erinaceieuropaei]
MCETNDSIPIGARVWPPCDSSAASDIDEVWDDSELLAHYEQVELQVRAQVEAFRAGRAAVPSRRRRKNHTTRTKRKEKLKLELPVAPSDNLHTASSSCPLDAQQADPTTGASVLSPVYPWLLPNVELPSEFLALQQSAYTSQCCSCVRHNQTMGASTGTNLCYVPPSPPQALQFPCITETALAATASTTAVTANSEFDTAALLRAWYEAGYAMGQAHAEQVLGVRKGKSVSTIGTGNSSLEQ